jgi:hypothetical protein
VFHIRILDVMGWDFITMWMYFISQNESDGGDWESKASVASSCSVFYALHLLRVVAACWAVWSPFPSFICPVHIILAVVYNCCKSLSVGKICVCHHLCQFGTEMMCQIDMACHLKRFYHLL